MTGSDTGNLEHIFSQSHHPLLWLHQFFSFPCMHFESWHCQCISFHPHGTQCIWFHFLCHHFLWWRRSTTQHHQSEENQLYSLGITKSCLLWFLDGLTLMTMIYRSGALCLQQLIWVHCCYPHLDCQAIPLSSTTSARVSNIASLTAMYSRKIASTILKTAIYLLLLRAITLIMSSSFQICL